MSLNHRYRPLAKAASVGFIAAAAFGLTACSEDTAGTETGTDVADIQEEDAAAPYDGPYDSDFYDGVSSYVGDEVTVSADVNEILSPSSFTIAGTDDTDVEALLVIGAGEVTGLETDLLVGVTGTVQQAFDLPTVEEELGVDLDDGLYESYDQEPYIVADGVDTSRTSGE